MTMYKVETHNNSKEYFSNIDIGEDYLHVTSNTGLSNMIKEVSNIELEKSWRIIDIENLMETLYSEWYEPLNKLRLKGEIRNILVNLKEEQEELNFLEEINFLEDNIDTLTNDIMNIAEAGVKNIKYENLSNTKLLIKEIYERLVQTDTFKDISIQILNYSNTVEFYKKLKGYNGGKIKKIYFYNLNNIDLKRYMIIELLRTVGFQVVFRIPYFHDLNVINKCWDKVYNDKEIFYLDPKNNSSANTDSKFISFLEGKINNRKINEKVESKTYMEVSDFRNRLKNKRVITFYKDSISACLDKYKDNNNHGFQTAIGRFLFNLYSVEIIKDDVKIDFDIYRELITSGWMEYKEWNGVRLIDYLTNNESYFSGVNSINEIINRIEKIKELEEVNDVFEEQVKIRIKNDNQKRFLSNPFRALGYNNCEKYNITSNYMYEVTLRLKRFIIKALKNENGFIDISDHFELLKIVFRNHYIINRSKDGNEFEKKVIKKIWAVLNSENNVKEKLNKDDIRELFNISLSMEIKEDIDEEKDFGIDQLEGMILRNSKIEKVNGESIIYLSDLSFKAYEEYINKKYLYGKILVLEDYKDILSHSLDGRHREIVVKGLEFQSKSIRSIEAYIKFAIGNLFINFNGIKSFSWISSLREDDTESILLKQIKAIYNLEDECVSNGLDFNDIVEEQKIDSKNYFYNDKEELKSGFSKYSEAAYRDLDFCSCKFLYSSILQPYPMYYTNFHQKLVFSGIVSILKNSIDDSYKNIAQFVFPLFPQWKEVVKSNILTCEFGRKNIRNYKYFEGINYPKNIDAIYLLKSKYIVGENWKIKNRYNKGNFKADEYYKEFINAYLDDDIYNSGIHCSMCPHIYACKKGEFLVGTK